MLLVQSIQLAVRVIMNDVLNYSQWKKTKNRLKQIQQTEKNFSLNLTTLVPETRSSAIAEIAHGDAIQGHSRLFVAVPTDVTYISTQ